MPSLTVEEDTARRSHAWLAIVLVLGAALVAFLPSLRDRFIADDFLLLKSSLDAGPARIWVSDFARGETAGDLYRPLVNASFLVDHSLWGLSAFGYHLTNGLLHVVTTGLLFVLALRLTRSRGIALAAAALFALQPAHAVSISWVSGRTDLLAGMFYALSLVAAVLWLEAPVTCIRHAWLAVALVGLAGALLSKEIGLAIPAVWAALAVILLLERRSLRTRRELMGAAVLAFAVVAVYFVMRHAALGTVLGGSSRATMNPVHLVKNAIYYVAFFFAPVANLTGSTTALGAALLATLAIGLLAIRALRRGTLTPGELAALVAVTAAPLAIVSTVRASWLEYVPSFGLSLLVAIVLAKNASDLPPWVARRAGIVGLAALVAYFAVFALPWSQDYRDNGELAAATIQSIGANGDDAYVLNVPIGSHNVPLWSVGLPQAAALLADERSTLVPVNFVDDVSNLRDGVAPRAAICGNLALVQLGTGSALTLYDRTAVQLRFSVGSALPKTTLVRDVAMTDAGPILAIPHDGASPSSFLAFNAAGELVPVQSDASLCNRLDTLFAQGR
ncbi:MAG: phospholipid carrier-dependent glycosyltransferase [Dehalococcoidia bacterium]|jgi:hypothetical protein